MGPGEFNPETGAREQHRLKCVLAEGHSHAGITRPNHLVRALPCRQARRPRLTEPREHRPLRAGSIELALRDEGSQLDGHAHELVDSRGVRLDVHKETRDAPE